MEFQLFTSSALLCWNAQTHLFSHFYYYFFFFWGGLQVCKWAAESLRRLSGCSALWTLVAKCYRIDKSCIEESTISLVQALGKLAKETSSTDVGIEHFDDAAALLSFLQDLSMSLPSFFLCGGLKLALEILADAIGCYKSFASGEGRGEKEQRDVAKERERELWEFVCLRVLRESRQALVRQELNEDLYFLILSLLDSRGVGRVVRSRIKGGRHDESESKTLSLTEEAMLWMKDFYYRGDCLPLWEAWLSTCRLEDGSYRTQMREAKMERAMSCIESTLYRGLEKGLPGAADVLPWLAYCFPGGAPLDFAIVIGFHLIRCFGSNEGLDIFINLDLLFFIMEKSRLYRRVDDPRHLEVLVSFANQVSQLVQESSSAELYHVALRCLIQMSKVDLRIIENEMANVWCLVWRSNSDSLDYEFLLSPFTSRRENKRMIETLCESIQKTFVDGREVIQDCEFFEVLAKSASSSVPISAPDIIEVVFSLWIDMIPGKTSMSREAIMSATEMFCTLLDNLKIVRQNVQQCSKLCESLFAKLYGMDIWKAVASCEDLDALSPVELNRKCCTIQMHSSLLRIAIDCEMIGSSGSNSVAGTFTGKVMLPSHVLPDNIEKLTKNYLNFSGRAKGKLRGESDSVATFRFVCCSAAIQNMSIIDAVDTSREGGGEGLCRNDALRMAEFLIDQALSCNLDNAKRAKRWNGVVSCVNDSNFCVALFHLIGSTFCHWSKWIQAECDSFDTLIERALKIACSGYQGRGNESSMQMKAASSSLLENIATSASPVIQESLVRTCVHNFVTCLADVKMSPILDEKTKKYALRLGEKVKSKSKNEKLMKHLQESMSTFMQKSAGATFSVEQMSSSLETLVISDSFRMIMRCFELSLESSGPSSFLVERLALCVAVMESMIVRQIKMVIEHFLLSKAKSVPTSECDSNLESLFSQLVKARVSLYSCLMLEFDVGNEAKAFFEKWCTDSILHLVNVLGGVDSAGKLKSLKHFSDFVSITCKIQPTDAPKQFTKCCSILSEKEQDADFLVNENTGTVLLKTIARALRADPSLPTRHSKMFKQLEKYVVRSILHLNQNQASNDAPPIKGQKMNGLVGLLRQDPPHLSNQCASIEKCLLLEGLVDVYNEIILFHAEKTDNSEEEMSQSYSIMELPVSFLNHLQCTQSIAGVLFSHVGVPGFSQRSTQDLQLFVWTRFLSFIDISLSKALPKVVSNTSPLRIMMVFSKVKTYCEAVLNRSSPSRIGNSEQNAWPLVSVECFSSTAVSGLWLKSRSQEMKSLRIQSNYADLHANCLLNELNTFSCHKKFQDCLAMLTSIIGWAPSMKLRINTIGRLLYLPIKLLENDMMSKCDLPQKCERVACFSRLIHACIKFRGNQCRRSAALAVQSAARVQSSLLSLEYMISEDQEISKVTFSKSQTRMLNDKIRSAASYLGDFYKELADQKDNFGKYLIHFLSGYVMLQQNDSVRSGMSESATILESGLCMLLGSCPSKDLKHLHMVFLGEKNNGNKYLEKLKKLHTKYEVHFKYQGKK